MTIWNTSKSDCPWKWHLSDYWIVLYRNHRTNATRKQLQDISPAFISAYCSEFWKEGSTNPIGIASISMLSQFTQRSEQICQDKWMDQILLYLTYPIDMPSTGQPLFMFQLSPSPHLVTHNFTYYSPRIKHRSSQCQDGVWPALVSQPILKLEKILSPQSSTPVPKFQHFSIFMHLYTLLIRCKKKSGRVANSPTQIVKTRLGLKILLCAQVLGPSPGLKHLLTETGNKALLIPDCAKTHSVQHLWYF